MALFHVGPMLLDNGSVILPGNWGRVLRRPERRKDPTYGREIAMEDFRAVHFGEKPSRLECVFTLPSLKALSAYWRHGNNVLSTAYEVVPLVESAPRHLGCWHLGLIDGGALDLIPDYWSSLRVDRAKTGVETASVRVEPEDEVAELLVGSPMRIVRRLDFDDPK